MQALDSYRSRFDSVQDCHYLISNSLGAMPNEGHKAAAAYAGMLVFGIVMALLGAVLPALSARLEYSVADIGGLFLAMNSAMLVPAKRSMARTSSMQREIN